MEFYENLQSLRKEKGLSQENLAESIGISRQAVAKWFMSVFFMVAALNKWIYM